MTRSGAGGKTAARAGPAPGAPSLEEILPYQINRLSFRMNQLLARDLHRRGMTIARWRILSVLATQEAATVNELAAAAMIEQSTLSRALQRLEAERHIRRLEDTSDARVRRVSLTETGRGEFEAVRDITLSHVARILRGLDDTDRHLLQRLVARMRQNIEQPL